jgi:AbiV family abortive infection protein
MPDLKLCPRKLNYLQYACFQNALRLHFDSVLLAKRRSFASAFAISVIASEELGKAFGIAEIIFQAGFDKGRLHAEDTKFVKALFSDHTQTDGSSVLFSTSLVQRMFLGDLKPYKAPGTTRCMLA